MENSTSGEWIVLKKKQTIDLPYDTKVEVMRENGSIQIGAVQGNWIAIKPTDICFQDLMSPIIKYRELKKQDNENITN